MAEPFRKAQEPVTEESVKQPVKKEKFTPVEGLNSGGIPAVETRDNGLLATYEQDQGKPFVASYFGTESIWDKEPSLARDLKEIEGYLRSKVEKKELDNSVRAAKDYLREMERKAGLSRYESTVNRIQKLLAYIEFKRIVES